MLMAMSHSWRHTPVKWKEVVSELRTLLGQPSSTDQPSPCRTPSPSTSVCPGPHPNSAYQALYPCSPECLECLEPTLYRPPLLPHTICKFFTGTPPLRTFLSSETCSLSLANTLSPPPLDFMPSLFCFDDPVLHC